MYKKIAMALPIQINSLAMDFEDLSQDKSIIRHIVQGRYPLKTEAEKAKLVNASYRNYRINSYRKIANSKFSVELPHNYDTEQYLIARESVRLLQRSLTSEEYYHLLNWFFNGGYKCKKTLAYYRLIAKIREKCKFILREGYNM
jgi:hypothetical protein